jgi:hypothetical protein
MGFPLQQWMMRVPSSNWLLLLLKAFDEFVS